MQNLNSAGKVVQNADIESNGHLKVNIAEADNEANELLPQHKTISIVKNSQNNS